MNITNIIESKFKMKAIYNDTRYYYIDIINVNVNVKKLK